MLMYGISVPSRGHRFPERKPTEYDAPPHLCTSYSVLLDHWCMCISADRRFAKVGLGKGHGEAPEQVKLEIDNVKERAR